MEKEVEIELKNLEDVIKECHRLLFESEHILVITPKFSLDMLKVIETTRAVFEKSDVFDGEMGLSKIIVEKFSKRMEKIAPLSVTKIHPGISKEMFEKEKAKAICVLVFEKPKIWKRFSKTSEERRQINEKWTTDSKYPDYLSGKSPYMEQLQNDTFGVSQYSNESLLVWFRLCLERHEFGKISQSRKSFQLSFIQDALNEQYDTYTKKEVEDKRISYLVNEGIRYDSIITAWWAHEMMNAILNRKDSSKMQNGRYLETAIPTKKIQKLVDVEKIDRTDYQLIEDIENIIEWYEFAIHLDPHNYWAWYNLGFIHYQQNDFVHAENEFVQCIKNNSEWYQADNLLAKIYRIQGFYNKAISTINSGLQKVQEDYEAHTLRSILETIADMTVTRAGIFLEAEKYEDALNDYDFCINLILEKKVNDGWLFGCHMGKIAALKEFGTKSQIIDVYDSMLENNPNDATTWNNVAYWHDKNEDSEKAIQCYNKALAIDPKLWTANLGVGEIYIKNGDREKAKPFIKDSSRNCPQGYKTEILEMHVENIEKILDDTEKKSFQEQVKDLGGFSLSSEEEENDKLAVQMLQKCEEFIFWIDPYFSAGGLNWIEKTCQQPTSVKKVEILTQFSGGKNARPEIFSPKFRKKFDKLRDVLSIESIELSMRICMDKEHCKLHDRYIITNEGRSWNIPSVMNFKRGTKDAVDPSTKNRHDFEDIWNKSLDYVKDQKEAEEKYEELKKNLDSEIT